METHSLETLLNWLKDCLACISKEILANNIQKLIIEFHNMDSNGQKFRYPILKTNQNSFPDQSYYDLKIIKQRVEKIANYFMAIDAWIDYYNSMAYSILEDLGYYEGV